MLTKTKTAALILQKHSQKQPKPNPQSSKSLQLQPQPKALSNRIPTNANPNPNQNSNSKQLSIRHLGHYDAFSLTFKADQDGDGDGNGEGEVRGRRDGRDGKGVELKDFCLLEKQNYRLIQANFQILGKFGTVVQMVRKELFRVVQFIQQYQYVFAVETVYSLLDTLTKIDNLNQSSSQSLKYFDRQSLKTSISPIPQPKQPNPLTSSLVQSYKLPTQKLSSPNLNPNPNPIPTLPPKKPFQICLGLSAVTYIPPKKDHEEDYVLADFKTPYFSQNGNSRRYELEERDRDRNGDRRERNENQRMRYSFQNSGFHSRVHSAMNMGKRELQISLSGHAQEKSSYQTQFIQQIRYSRPSHSQKNIIIMNNSTKKTSDNDNKAESTYRLLLSQASCIQYLLNNH